MVAAPTLPHVTLPRVDVHEMSDRVHGFAASAAERIEELPDKAVALAGTVIPALRPAPKRSVPPIVLVLVVLAAALGVGWFVRSRRNREPDASYASVQTGQTNVSAAS